MAELLELPQLMDEHRMSQMQVRRGGVEPRLDLERPAALDSLAQVGFVDDVDGTPFQFGDLPFQVLYQGCSSHMRRYCTGAVAAEPVGRRAAKLPRGFS